MRLQAGLARLFARKPWQMLRYGFVNCGGFRADGSAARRFANDFETIRCGGPLRLQRRNNGLSFGLAPMLARLEFADEAVHGDFERNNGRQH